MLLNSVASKLLLRIFGGWIAISGGCFALGLFLWVNSIFALTEPTADFAVVLLLVTIGPAAATVAVLSTIYHLPRIHVVASLVVVMQSFTVATVTYVVTATSVNEKEQLALQLQHEDLCRSFCLPAIWENDSARREAFKNLEDFLKIPEPLPDASKSI